MWNGDKAKIMEKKMMKNGKSGKIWEIIKDR